MWLYLTANKFFKVDKEWKEDYTFYRLPFGKLQTTIDTNNYYLPVNQPKFFGKCYLAMNGRSISASVDFASWFKQSKRGLILGEECMGPISGTCGNPVAVKLKNTNVSFISSSMRSYAGNGFEILSDPIQPDVLIKYNLNNFRYKIDPILEYLKNNN
jgi:C-terminal processing protease CtpA/Prc